MRTSYFRDIAMAQDAKFVQQKSTNPYLAGTGATQLTRQKSGWATPSNEELAVYRSIAKARGIDDPSKIFHMLNRVAWHESAKTMDPKLREQTPKGSKWNEKDYGIGLFQYKKDSAITGAKRAKNFLTSQGVTIPDWILNLEKTGDVGSLDVSQQRILASLDMAENPKFAMGDASGSNEYLVKNWGKAWQTQSDPKKMDKFTKDQASYGGAYAKETDWRPTAPPPAPEQINNTVPVDNTATQIMVDPRVQMQKVPTPSADIKAQQGTAVGGNLGYVENYSKFNNNNNMRTSYFRDIAESMARDGRASGMQNGGRKKSLMQLSQEDRDMILSEIARMLPNYKETNRTISQMPDGLSINMPNGIQFDDRSRFSNYTDNTMDPGFDKTPVDQPIGAETISELLRSGVIKLPSGFNPNSPETSTSNSRMRPIDMRTSYFRDIANKFNNPQPLSQFANGSYVDPMGYYQDSGSPSMEVARRPTQREFVEAIYDTLPAAWRDMPVQDAWNAFQQLTVQDQNRLAQNAGLVWTDVATVGTGMEGAGRRPARVPENQMTQVTGEAIPIYESLVRLNDLPMKADGTFITEDEWYALPIETQASWAQDAARRSQEKIAGYQGDIVYEQRRPTYTGEDIYTPGQAAETPPMRKPTPTGGGTGKRRKRKGGARPAPQAQGTRTSTPATEEKRRGLSTQEMYGKGVPKRVLGGPNTIMDFFANARDGQFPSRLQDGQLMHYSDLEKAQFGKFIKGLGRTIYDFGRAKLDAVGNTTGLFDIPNEGYKTELGKKLSGTADKWFRGVGSVGRMAANVFLPGSGTALGMVGSALNPGGLGSKQTARDQQRKAANNPMAASTQGMGSQGMGSQNMSNIFGMTPGLMNMLPSLLGGPMSPGGATGYTTGNYGGGMGMMAQGGMPPALVSHMEFMGLFEDPQAYKKGSGPYLVY